MSDYLHALFLGIVEGLTEFLPISSTGHMILVEELILGISENKEFWSAFEIVIQLGAILAVVVLYKSRFLNLFGLDQDGKIPAIREILFPKNRLGLAHIAVAIIPALALGYTFRKFIKEHLFSSETVVLALIVGGVWMVVSKYKRPVEKTVSMDELTLKQAALIGLGQCLSLWPGFSRSGATMLTGIYMGVNQKTAAEFSFIVAVPVMIAATGYETLNSYQLFTADMAGVLAVGFIVSFLVAILAIKTFINLLGKVTLAPFGWYRIVLALVVYVLLLA